jgi:hypothetical protein
MDGFGDLTGFSFSKAKNHQPIDLNNRKELPKDGPATTRGPIIQVPFPSTRQKKFWGAGSDQNKDRMEVEASSVSFLFSHDS